MPLSSRAPHSSPHSSRVRPTLHASAAISFPPLCARLDSSPSPHATLCPGKVRLTFATLTQGLLLTSYLQPAARRQPSAPASSRTPPGFGPPAMDDDALKCYTYRHVDLLAGYCHDNVLSCDWNALREHKQTHAVQEGRKVACKNRDTQCYAYRNTDLFDSLCAGDITSCNWLGLVTHFAQKGRFEGKTMECETPETKCYLQRNPDLAVEFCGNEGDDTCEWPRVVEHLIKNAESEGRPTGCLPPSPPPSPLPPPPPPSPPPRPRPPPPPPIMIVGTNGKAVTRLDSASAPSPLGGSVVIITIGITTIAVILYCFCRIYAGQPQPRLSRAPDPKGTRARLLMTRARTRPRAQSS